MRPVNGNLGDIVGNDNRVQGSDNEDHNTTSVVDSWDMESQRSSAKDRIPPP